MNKGKITISRPSYGDGREKIVISIEDRDAVVRFVEVELDLPEFAKAITGQGNINCELKYRNLEVLGKKRETKEITFKISDKYIHSDRKQLAIEAAKEHTPEGWIASEYYGSQSSFFTKNNEQWAKTTITTGVDKVKNNE